MGQTTLRSTAYAIPAAMHFGTCLRMRMVKLGAKLNGKQGRIKIMSEDRMQSCGYTYEGTAQITLFLNDSVSTPKTCIKETTRNRIAHLVQRLATGWMNRSSSTGGNRLFLFSRSYRPAPGGGSIEPPINGHQRCFPRGKETVSLS